MIPNFKERMQPTNQKKKKQLPKFIRKENSCLVKNKKLKNKK